MRKNAKQILWPLTIAMIIGIALIAAFPQIALFLPNTM